MTQHWLHSAIFLSLYVVSCINARNIPLELVDLGHSYSNGTVFSYPKPGDTVITAFWTWFLWKGVTPSGVWYQAKEFDAKEHSGTHIDAPAHFAEGHWTVDQIPIERLINVPAVVVDIREKAARIQDATVDVSDLENWEYNYGPIPDGCVVLMLSGWSKFYGNFTQYTGSLNGINPEEYHFPGFSIEAAYWLGKRKVYAIGTDAASVDVGKSLTYPVHVYLQSLDFYIIENLVNLDQLSPSGWRLNLLPIKLKDGTGGPARVVAFREKLTVY